MKNHLVKNQDNFWFLFFISLLIFGLLVVFASFVGAAQIPFFEVIKALFQNSTETNNFIVFNLRIPRIIIASLAGSTLAVSGVFVQSSLKNPLTSPGILGISIGAAFGAVLTNIAFPNFFFLTYLGAMLFGLITFSLILLFSFKGGLKPFRIILVGLAINSFFAALIGLIYTFNIDKLGNVFNFLNGTINGTWEDATKIIVLGIPLLLFSFFFAKSCDVLLLDDKVLNSLGIRIANLRMKVIIMAVALVSTSIYICGIIGFVGLIVPHFVKIFVNSDHKKIIPLSIIWGSILVLASDVFGTILFRPFEIPVGILIAFLGSILFIYILRKQVN